MALRRALPSLLIGLLVCTALGGPGLLGSAAAQGGPDLLSSTDFLAAPAAPATALGPGFSYNGRLFSGGAGVTGNCDFDFGLWDAATAGAQVGATQTVTSLAINAGLFTATLNAFAEFDGSAFDGSARWLAIAVRCPAGGGNFTHLSPRQALLAAPYALYAVNAGSADVALSALSADAAPWNGLTGVPAGFADGTDDVGGGAAGWQLAGNGITGTEFLGTTNNMTLTLAVSGTAAFRLVPNDISPNVLGGHISNTVSGGVHGATIGGGGATGLVNTVSASFGTIGGGQNNAASGGVATVAGGSGNTASGGVATVAGGTGNTASGPYATVGGGAQNTASSFAATVGGGNTNSASGTHSTVSGGSANAAGGDEATIGGGFINNASGDDATISGGWGNTASFDYATVAGGAGNTASGFWSTVGGGQGNTSNTNATVAGGADNTALGAGAFVGGGNDNAAGGADATISGGFNNTASGDYATISGGQNNTAYGYATIGGGLSNIAGGAYATVGGGAENLANGAYATVAGGRYSDANGNYSFAAGRNAHALHTGSFVWADANTEAISSTVNNQFLVRASGGISLTTNDTGTTGCRLSAGGGTWNCTSDRNAKENFAAVDAVAVLDALMGIPIETWNFNTQDESIRHIGPMAQDFNAAFHVGESETQISAVDADGVALAAIQGLYTVVQAKEAALTEQADRIAALSIECRSAGRPG